MRRTQCLLLSIVFLLLGCTTQKNTLLTRSYHNLTAYYNVYWNGKQAYNRGLKRIESNYRDNYSYVLPIFLYGIEETSSMVSSDMQRAMNKATKSIEEHSIKAKPKKLEGKANLTSEEQAFYNKNEYNKWLDDAYLLIAKGHLYNMDFNLSAQTLRFMLNEFNHDPEILYDAYIWLARVQNVNNNFRESREILERLHNRDEFEPLIDGDYYKTYADFHLRQKQYPKTIDFLEKALAEERKRKNKIRYNFILAQLNQELHQYKKASDHYKKVIKMNPPYEMGFNAKLSQAFTYQSGAGSVRQIEQDLLEMLDDEKNRDFKDQIYYALGQLMFREGNEDKAIEYYKLSSSNSVDNDNQKTTSLLAIADIYFERSAYQDAGIYYDSADMFISESYPDYHKIKEKTEVFIQLVRNLNTITLEDSLQNMASLPEAQRMHIVDQAIRQYVEEERRARQAEIQRMQQMALHARRTGQDRSTSGSSWYFYNPSAVTRGKQEFIARWGDRKLEDNWRRKNKEQIVGFSDAMTVDEVREEQAKKADVKTDPKSREYYLQYIPLTDSAMEVSHKRLKEAYMTAGAIYKEELGDNQEAIKIYEEFLSRYPDDDMVPLTMYNLYKICVEANDLACKNKYKQKIFQQYPNSLFAKVIEDPEYLLQLQEEQEEISALYEETLQFFKFQRYHDVIQNTNLAHQEYPEKQSYLRYFDYLKTISLGQTKGIPAFKKALRDYIEKYPSTEQSEEASVTLAYLDREHPDILKEEKLTVAQEIYNSQIEGKHYFVVEVDYDEEKTLNQLRFNIINFNLDHFDDKDMEVETESFEEDKKILIISPFDSKAEAMDYYRLSEKYVEDVYREIESKEGVRMFIINEQNLEIFKENQDGFAYEQFFRLNYLDKQK